MNARKKKLQLPLDKVLADQPLDRITELEREVQQLKDDVALLKDLSGSPFFNEVATEPTKPTKQKPGKKAQISDEELFGYRNGLILWLEPVWPWLSERLVAARTVDQVTALLEAIAKDPPEQRPRCQQRLLQNAAALFAFLFDEKYRKTDLTKSQVMDALSWPGMHSPVPKPCRPISTQPSDPSSEQHRARNS